MEQSKRLEISSTIVRPDPFHIRTMMQTAIIDAKTIEDVEKGAIRVLRIASHEAVSGRLGYVSGIISSLGKDRIQEMEARLDKFTTYVGEMWGLDSYNFPMFSSTDIFTRRVLKKLGKLTQDQFNSFWNALLESGFVTDVFMTPYWRISKGATAEYEIARKRNMTIHYWDIGPEDDVHILYVGPEHAKRHVCSGPAREQYYLTDRAARIKDLRFLRRTGDVTYVEVKRLIDRTSDSYMVKRMKKEREEKKKKFDESARLWQEYYDGKDARDYARSLMRQENLN